MFPEGTRNTGDDILLPLKSGLSPGTRRLPQRAVVPVWIENLKRVLPKGVLVPIPLACTVALRHAHCAGRGGRQASFLARARTAMLDMRPEYDRVEQGNGGSAS